MEIRPATLLDLRHVIALAKATAEETNGWWGWSSDEVAARHFASIILGYTPGWILLAFEGTQPVGLLSEIVSGKDVMGEYLYVVPWLRGRRVLRALFARHRAFAKALALETETVLAAPSRSGFWQKHGYQFKASILTRTLRKRGT